ncbi:MAG TPA: hypothetical protein VL400_26835, partial [Polyangiaceae bacterium]|nr:hypothetical protein [Polyangiaceae bacterium]
MTLLGRRRSVMLLGSGTALAVAALGLGACEGTLGDGGVSGPPDVEPKAVPEAPTLVASTTTCIARSEGEHLLSVSPEGHAWLVTPGPTTHVRVLDAFGGDITVAEDELEIADVQDGQAWSAGDAALLSDGGLWRLEGMSRIDMTPPDGFETPASLCGDPSDSGVLVSNGSVFERRSDGWWTWDPKASPLSSPSRVVRFDGECRSADDVMWLAALDGTLYRVEPSTFTTPIRFDGLVDLAATDGLVAALDASELWIGTSGDAWQPWTFSGDVPTSLSASAGVVWMVSGSQILRFDGSDWSTIANDVGEPIETVGAHAGGAWLEGPSQICHASLGQSLRVEGVRPYLRSTELEYDVRVEASDGAMDLTAELDGAPVDLG